MFSSGLSLKDVQQALGDAFCSVIPNDYHLVREAIDRGVPLDDVKPGNKITAQLKRLVLAQDAAKTEAKALPLLKKLKLAAAR
jgi:pilus assembly protein CpaE